MGQDYAATVWMSVMEEGIRILALLLWSFQEQQCSSVAQPLQSSDRNSPRCCRWWSVWMSIPPGTMACVRSRLCWRWRWCKWSWCSRRRSSGLCSARRCLKPTQKWSHGLFSPGKKRSREDPIRGCRFVCKAWKGVVAVHQTLLWLRV